MLTPCKRPVARCIAAQHLQTIQASLSLRSAIWTPRPDRIPAAAPAAVNLGVELLTTCGFTALASRALANALSASRPCGKAGQPRTPPARKQQLATAQVACTAACCPTHPADHPTTRRQASGRPPRPQPWRRLRFHRKYLTAPTRLAGLRYHRVYCKGSDSGGQGLHNREGLLGGPAPA